MGEVDVLSLPWVTSGPGGLAVVAVAAGAAPGRDPLVGLMSSAEVAALVVEAHNASLSVHPGASDANRLIRAHLAAVERGDSPAA